MIGFSNKNFIKAMDLIDASHEAGHVLSNIKYAELYRHQDKHYLRHAFDGKTTNPHFEDLPTLGRGYRLKVGMSAHKALFSLLNEKETIIECGVALSIAYYLFVYFEMEDRLGKEEAQERFDSLFGSQQGTFPANQRLVISPFSITMGTAFIPQFGILPVQPLSFLMEGEDYKTKNEMTQNAKIGSQIVFAGDPNYTKIHPAGAEGAYNGIITSLNPIKVRIFDHPAKEWTEEDLYAFHKKAYSTVVSLESFALLDVTFRRSEAFLQMIDNPTSEDKIPGFVPYLFSVNPEKLNFLIHAPINEVNEAIQIHIGACHLRQVASMQGKKTPKDASEQDILSSFQKLSLSSLKKDSQASQNEPTFLSDLKPGLQKAYSPKATSSTPSRALPKKLAGESYAGLDGLRGAFSSPKKKEPPKRHEEERKGGYLPGFSSGFLNNPKKSEKSATSSSHTTAKTNKRDISK